MKWMAAVLAAILWSVLVYNVLVHLPDSVQLVLFMFIFISLPSLYKVLINRREP